jgi:hypothetical protein
MTQKNARGWLGISPLSAPLVANWRRDLPDLDELPLRRGTDDYSGVKFDVRGIVQLGQNLSGLRNGGTGVDRRRGP